MSPCCSAHLLQTRPPVLVRTYHRPLTPQLLDELDRQFVDAEEQLRAHGALFDVHHVQAGKTPMDVQSGVSVATLQINLQTLVTAVYKLYLGQVLTSLNFTAGNLDAIWDSQTSMQEWSGLISGHIVPGLFTLGSQAQRSTAHVVLPQFAATFNVIWAWLIMAGIPPSKAVEWLALVAKRVEDVPLAQEPPTERAQQVCAVRCGVVSVSVSVVPEARNRSYPPPPCVGA